MFKINKFIFIFFVLAAVITTAISQEVINHEVIYKVQPKVGNTTISSNVVRKYSIVVQDPTNGIAWIQSNPFTTNATINSVASKTLGNSSLEIYWIAIKGDATTINDTTYTIVESNLLADTTYTEDTSLAGDTTMSNNFHYGVIITNQNIFEITNRVVFDFVIQTP